MIGKLLNILKRIIFLVGITVIIVLCGISTIFGIVARYLIIIAIIIYLLKNKEKYIKIIKKQ